MQVKQIMQAWDDNNASYDDVVDTAAKNAQGRGAGAYDKISGKSAAPATGNNKGQSQQKGVYDSLKQQPAQGGTYDSLKKKTDAGAVDYEIADSTVDYDIADDTTAQYEIASATSSKQAVYGADEESVDYDLADDTTASYELASKTDPTYSRVARAAKVKETDVDDRRDTVFFKPNKDIRKKPVLQLDIMEA